MTRICYDCESHFSCDPAAPANWFAAYCPKCQERYVNEIAARIDERKGREREEMVEIKWQNGEVQRISRRRMNELSRWSEKTRWRMSGQKP